MRLLLEDHPNPEIILGCGLSVQEQIPMTPEDDKLTNKLEELEQLKSNFIAIASHELRTPLGLILGHATFLHELIEEDLYKQQLDVIIRNAGKLKDVIDGLAKIENYQKGQTRVRNQTIDLNEFVNSVVSSYAAAAEQKNISLSISPNPWDLTIDGESEKLTTALGNILENAIAFTNSDGQVKVRIEQLAQFAKISIIDNGIGIPAKYIQRVFDRFFQVEDHLTRLHNGMGLGLSVAKAMIEVHGGLIWVESVEGEGSTFSFILPLKAK